MNLISNVRRKTGKFMAEIGDVWTALIDLVLHFSACTMLSREYDNPLQVS